jgi:hypothetical protein
MKTYKINHNGFNVGLSKGKKNAIEYVKRCIAWNGLSIDSCQWGKWVSGVLKIKSQHNNEFVIQESK